MSTTGSANLVKIGLNNAAKFPNDVLVINLGTGQLGDADGFDIDLALKADQSLPGTVTTYIQPNVETADQIRFGVNGTLAASAGNDSVTFLGPSQFENPFAVTMPVATGGPGDDSLTVTTEAASRFVQPTAYGGSGDDTLTGGQENDTLRGDHRDDGSISPAGILTLDVPAATEGNDQLFGMDGDDKLFGDGGDDRLFGQRGSDTLHGDWGSDFLLYGEGGNDFLDGGPRGEGYLDVLTGGDGADAFILNYSQDTTDGSSFWGEYSKSVLGEEGLDEVQAIFEAGGSALEEAIGSLASGLFLGGVGTAVGTLLESFIDELLKTPSPKSKEDVLVITDFNPAEDVLFLPIESGLTLESNPSFLDSSPVSGLSGYAITYTKGTSQEIFAEVFLDQAYLKSLGISSTQSAAAETALQNVIDTSVTITSSGIQNMASISSLAENKALEASTAAGTDVQVFGAFGPMSIVYPAGTPEITAAGTVYGDIITVNERVVLPQHFAPTNPFSPTDGTTIVGFAGNDVLYGSAGPDLIQGGDGDDAIYGFFPAEQDSLSDADDLIGGAGDDLIVTGMSLAEIDGGDGTDTLSFQYSTLPVTVDLKAGSAFDGIGTAAKPNYTIARIENVTGTGQDDTIAGDPNDNVIDGAGGSDHLDGRGGTDLLSFASIAGPVSVDLGSNVATVAGKTSSVVNFENILGTTAADKLVGDANANVINGNGGADTLDGGGGTDTVSLAGLTTFQSETITIDLRNQKVSGPGTDGVTIAGFEAAIGGAKASNTFYGFTDAAVQSELVGAQVTSVSKNEGNDIITTTFEDIFHPNAAAETLRSNAELLGVIYTDSPAAVSIDLTQPGPHSGGWAEGDVFDFTFPEYTIEGSAFADRLAGNGDKLLYGGDGGDLLSGSNNDALYGQQGDDTLTGKGGATLTGGPGADIFEVGTGSNTAMDFTYKDGDRIDVTAYDITTYKELANRISILEYSPFYARIVGNGPDDAFEFQSIDGAAIPPDNFILAPAAPGLFTADSNADAHTSIEFIGKHAAYDNALGLFEIMADDTIGAVEILIPSSQAEDVGSRIALDSIGLGDRYGFFLVQDHPLTGPDGSFGLQDARDGSGLELADLLDPGTEIGLVQTGSSGSTHAIDAKIFLSTDLGDGMEQARTTLNDDGSTLLVFEDQDRAVASDNDFNDLEILITSATTEPA